MTDNVETAALAELNELRHRLANLAQTLTFELDAVKKTITETDAARIKEKMENDR